MLAAKELIACASKASGALHTGERADGPRGQAAQSLLQSVRDFRSASSSCRASSAAERGHRSCPCGVFRRTENRSVGCCAAGRCAAANN